MVVRSFILTLIISLCLSEVDFAQCPTADFSTNSSVCRNEILSISNSSVNAIKTEWDFCDGSILNTPNTSLLKTLTGVSGSFDMSTQVEGSLNYSFVISKGNSRLYRLDHGNTLGASPTINDLGNFSGLITNPQGIDFYSEGGNHYALVSNSSGSIVRLSFANSITTTPITSLLPGISGLTDLRHIKIINEGANVYAFIAGGGGSGVVTVLDFGSTILNTPTIRNFPISASFLTGIEVVHECNQWYVLTVGYLSGLHTLNFGNSLANTPSVSTFSSISAPIDVSVVKSAGLFYAFIPTDNNGNLVRLAFGNSISNTPTSTNLGNFGLFSLTIGYDMIKTGSKYSILALNNGDNKLSFLDFPKNCNLTDNYYGVAKPEVLYSAAGTFNITLTVYDNAGNPQSLTKSINVSNSVAPDIDFTGTVKCASLGTNFVSQNVSGDINSYSWDFGDGNSSSSVNPINSYSAGGKYGVKLVVQSTGGCTNIARDSVLIYNIPNVDFSLPAASPICTNQLYSFVNATVFDSGSNPTWEWRVNGILISNANNLSYSISAATSQVVNLKAIIPGCENEATKSISVVEQGPMVDFSFANDCKDKVIAFTNTTVGATSFSWNFGDGNTSSDVNPTNTFLNAGVFSIKLNGSNVVGCQNSATKTITIYSKPVPDFSLALPPFSCSGSPSQFNDLTPNPVDSNLASWLWSFDDPGSGLNSSTIRNAQHTYNTAGDYNVSLTAKTNFGCEATVMKKITVSASPTITFTNTPACQDQGTNFNDQSDNAQSWFWQIENTTYNIKNPIHVFAASGDYPVNLTVTSTNNCISFLSKSINVPKPLVPDFSFQKNCVDQNTMFVDLTDGTVDPVIGQQWTFGSLGETTGSPATFTFASTGTVGTTLEVTAQSGCKYSVTKNVTIEIAPTASFTATPEAGVPPLDVAFLNKSINASSYLWTFNDINNTTSTEVSPSYTFNDTGDHVVDLTAYNNLGCYDTFSKIIKAMLPVYDISLIGFNVIKNDDGSLKMIAALRNDGNVSISNMSLELSISGVTSVREAVTELISPQASANHVLSYEIADASNLGFLCAKIILVNDLTTDDNERCVTLDKPYFLYDPYPNPTSDLLTISWIANSTEPLSIIMIDALGNQVMTTSLTSEQGLNTVKVLTDDLAGGIYAMVIKYGTYKEIKRISVEH